MRCGCYRNIIPHNTIKFYIYTRIYIYKMSAGTSKTGLQSAPTLPINYEKSSTVPELKPLTGPAPVVLRPFAGIHNPFPQSCSVLCNHPAEHISANRKAFYARAQTSLHEKYASNTEGQALHPSYDWIPEVLFRRYTESESRPVTPAPTLASIGGNSHRRCVTPDPAARTLLVLDLRRSQSQETLSWRGMVAPAPLLTPPPPPAKRHHSPIQPLPRRSSSSSRFRIRRTITPHSRSTEPLTPLATNQSEPVTVMNGGLHPSSIGADTSESPMPVSTPRRRGLRRRRRRVRDGAASPEKQEFKGLDEPGETQISAMGEGDVKEDYQINSASICVADEDQNGLATNGASGSLIASGCNKEQSSGWCSFLHNDILNRLQRQLCWEDVEAEFDYKRRAALEEAMKAPRLRTITNEELMNELQQKQNARGTELWMGVPRAFSRRSARFELPIDSRRLARMSPLQYLRDCVCVSESRRLLYNTVFNRHRELSSLDNEARVMQLQNVPKALTEVMGHILSEETLQQLSRLLDVQWRDKTQSLDFRAFCGIAAACERLFGVLPPINIDPLFELESADFESLSRKLSLITDPQTALPTLLTQLVYR